MTCGSDKTIKLWNPKKQLLLQTYSGHGFEVMDADCSCDSSQIVSGSQDKTVIVWDVSSGHPIRRYRAHIAAVNSVCFNEDSSLFISGSVDGTVKIWDCKSNSREAIQILDEAKDSISHLAVTDHEIVSVSLDNNLRCYDIRKGMMECDCLYCEFTRSLVLKFNYFILFLIAPLTYVSLTNDCQCMLVSCLNNQLQLLDKSNGDVLAT